MTPPMITIDHDNGITLVWCYGESPGYVPVKDIYDPFPERSVKDVPVLLESKDKATGTLRESMPGDRA